MKKCYTQAALLCAAAILLAYMMASVLFNYASYETGSSLTDDYQNAMLDGKAFFLQAADPIQETAAELLDRSGTLVMQDADGTPRLIENGRAVPLADGGLSETLCKNLTGIFSGGELRAVSVTPDAVCYITDLFSDGFVGFMYEKDMDRPTSYETIEIVENWRLFYEMR